MNCFIQLNRLYFFFEKNCKNFNNYFWSYTVIILFKSNNLEKFLLQFCEILFHSLPDDLSISLGEFDGFSYLLFCVSGSKPYSFYDKLIEGALFDLKSLVQQRLFFIMFNFNPEINCIHFFV